MGASQPAVSPLLQGWCGMGILDSSYLPSCRSSKSTSLNSSGSSSTVGPEGSDTREGFRPAARNCVSVCVFVCVFVWAYVSARPFVFVCATHPGEKQSTVNVVATANKRAAKWRYCATAIVMFVKLLFFGARSNVIIREQSINQSTNQSINNRLSRLVRINRFSFSIAVFLTLLLARKERCDEMRCVALCCVAMVYSTEDLGDG
mmetsp:Transcript_11018/g.31930  ORF Transcript_11018/g.31930 Transcript_11018/m.31930 type:complete len:204 (-) Transcript_11018:7-618(-)